MDMDDTAAGAFVSPGYLKLCRASGLVLCVVFAAVGVLFLFWPASVAQFFNTLARNWGLPQSPIPSPSLYTALAAAYMYVVTLLALGMYCRPEVRAYSLLLIQAKSASAVLSIILCFTGVVQIILIINAIVDGAIALGVAHIEFRGRKREG